ncbi:MAG: type IX secretion system sortase PorU [Prolixibacteraceae bacterium]|jgi:protein involved in ribonucleotide reduction
MLRLLLLSIFLFVGTFTRAADYHRKINWFQPDQTHDSVNTIDAFRFEGSITLDRSSGPYWFESFDLNSSSADVTITNPVFEPVGYATAGLNDSIGAELKYTSEIGTSAGHSILRLTVCPFVFRNNTLERLVEFTVSVNENSKQLKSTAVAYSWKTSSVLGSGKWVRISTNDKGVYKITFDQVKEWGFPNPDQVSLYGNGGYMLPVLNKDTRFDDLNAYPIWKGKDGAGKDCMFFYSTGNIRITENVSTGTFSHQQNSYSTLTYFYLSDQGSPKTIQKAAALSESAENTVNSYPNYSFYEKELKNLIASGSQWFGEQFSTGSSQTINLALDNPDLTKSAQFVVSAVGKSSSVSSMHINLNGKSESGLSFRALDLTDPTNYFADEQVSKFTETLPSKNLELKLTYNAVNSTSGAWFDYFSVNYTSLMNMNTDVYFFRGKGNDGQVTVSEFILNGASSATKILDITDFSNVYEVPATYADGQMKFKSNSSTTCEYVAFNPAGTIPVPDFVNDVDNQNLHAADLSEMIIVSNPALLSAANDLANFHRSNDQMSVQVLTPDVIYNEFSGGLPDPAAFRNYFKMCYDRGRDSGTNTLKYILLMGDGSYDNRNILGENHNLIPTYQSPNSLSLTESFVTDDFFVFLDENEGGSKGTIDLGIGRIPTNTLMEAEGVVKKIKHYHDPETFGNWRNTVTFIADDGNTADNYTNAHMSQAEEIATFLNQSHPSFYTDKIYFDTYKKTSTAGGEKYPDVTIGINNSVKKGTLIMNYTGHANERNLADEGVLDIGNIDSWTNYNRLPIFVTATCEYSRFDADDTSAGERILFNSHGGGVGLFSTTRLVYSGANSTLNKNFFRYVFAKDDAGKNLRLGEIMRRAKAAANTGTNQLNFTLLADPAMQLANPDFQVKTTSIDGKNTETEVDTIQTLTVVTVKGFVADIHGEKLSSFNGEIIPTVYDKAMQVKTLGNSGQNPMSYTMQSSIIYKGLASVTNGDFEFSFFVPKDVSYKIDKGKIIYYAYDDSNDAHGYFDGFYIGGSSNSSISDSDGPQINLFINSESFQDGGTVSASSVLLANISDDTGINTAGTGIGHDITAILDDDYTNIMVLNDYFQSDKDQYLSGKIVYPLTKLTEGEHVLKLKVWDVLNNSAEKEIHFVVKDNFRIETVASYPNPMQGQTKFIFTHNQPDETFDIDLEVFQTNGMRVDFLQTTIGSLGTESLPIEWIPANRHIVMKAGIYIYRITATTVSGGKQTSGSGRLVYVYP